MMECIFRQAVEAKRREKVQERESTAGQVQGMQVCFREEEQSEETRAQSTDEQDMMTGHEEERTGRGSAGPVRGGMRDVERTRPPEKAKEKGTEEKENIERKEELDADEEDGSKWRLTWGLVAHTPRPRQTWKKKRRPR